MALEQKLNLRLSQRLVMTPSLQQAIKLLQMSKLELEETITQEMVENPLLEDDQEEPPEPVEADPAEAPKRRPSRRSPRPRPLRPTPPAAEEQGLVRGDRLQLLLRGLPRHRIQPAAVRRGRRGLAAREHAHADPGPPGVPELAAGDGRRGSPRQGDRGVPRRQHRRRRLPARVPGGDPGGRVRRGCRRRGRLDARACLRPGGHLRLRHARLPDAPGPRPRHREPARREGRRRALAGVPEPPVRTAHEVAGRHDDGAAGGLRDRQEPRAQSRAPVLQRAHDLRRARCRRAQDRRRVRDPAERGRAAAPAHLGRLPADAAGRQRGDRRRSGQLPQGEDARRPCG